MRRFVLSTVLILAVPAYAQVQPTPGYGDPRLQTVRYDPEQIVQLSLSPGYQLMVSFSQGEHIETIALGNSSSYQATASKRGDVLFVKTTGYAPATNMTVVTDARVYQFELSASGSKVPFAVRFVFPDAPPPPAIAAPAVKYRYRIGGSKAIRPDSVSFDGARTAIGWPQGIALPAMFRVEDDGAESLVNTEMQDGKIIIAGAPRELIFRLDRQVARATRSQVREPRR